MGKKWSEPKGKEKLPNNWVKRTTRYDNPTWKKKNDKYDSHFIGVAKLGESWTFTGKMGITEYYGIGKNARKKAMSRAKQYMKDN